MVDVHDKATRSCNMSRIRGKDTKPELAIRKGLHGWVWDAHEAKWDEGYAHLGLCRAGRECKASEWLQNRR